MDRRKFIKTSALGCGVAALPELAQARTADKAITSQHVATEEFVREPARRIPVLDSADVVVVGGGPAGFAAAVSAARAGCSVYMIERYNHLGGLWTGGLVLVLNCTHGLAKNGKWSQAICGISDELMERLYKIGMSDRYPEQPTPDPEACKYMMGEMVEEAGIHVIYGSLAANVLMSGDRIDSVLVETKSGRVALRAKMVIDCTGDGDVIEWAGDSFVNFKCEMGLNSRLGGIDTVNADAPGYVPHGVGAPTPIPSVGWVNMREGEPVDALDVKALSACQHQFRKTIWERVEKLRKCPGYEKVFLLDTASQLGVRAGRILQSVHNVTLEESVTYAEFDDVVGVSGSWTTVPFRDRKIQSKERPIWQIPLRALIPKKCTNLFVAGRCFGFEEGLFEDAREIGTCLVTGQGAGVAAAVAVAQRCSNKDVDVRRVQTILRQQKVRLDV